MLPVEVAGAAVFASASRDEASGDLILKVVNAGDGDQELEIDLRCASAREASGEILTGQPGDVNSIPEPERATPKPLAVRAAGPQFSQSFPAHSVSVIRLKVGL